MSPSASRFFSMAAIVVPDEHDAAMREVIRTIRRDLSVPATKPLHWQEHVKTYQRRQHVTELLKTIPGLVVNYIIFEKGSIPATAVLRVDHARFYNFVAGMTVERILLTAAHWPGGPREVNARFGHVRGFNHGETLNYLASKRSQANCSWLRWDLLTSLKFEDAGALLGLQAADQYAGILNVAMTADRYGGYEPWHLLDIRQQIRRGPKGTALNYGFKPMVLGSTLNSYPWWPQPSGI